MCACIPCQVRAIRKSPRPITSKSCGRKTSCRKSWQYFGQAGVTQVTCCPETQMTQYVGPSSIRPRDGVPSGGQGRGCNLRSHSETQKETYNNVVQRATTGPAPGNRDSLAPVEPQRTFA